MKIFIELPRWLGDAVMTTPAIENLVEIYPNADITIFGSYPATEALSAHPNIRRVIIDSSRDRGIRVFNIIRLAKSAGSFDLAISFRSHFYSRLLLAFIDTPKRYIYNKKQFSPPKGKTLHQVERYNNFISNITKKPLEARDLKLYHKAKEYKKPTMGINPGATYGSAKRWYPDKFAEVARAKAKDYDIVIFGSINEKDMADEIEEILKAEGVENITNRAGQTTITELCQEIGGLSLFITGDSGPMHIAGAYKVPTVAIFGPTKYKETNQWRNPYSQIVRKELSCSPCMKRTCPIKTHECMRGINPKDVVEAIGELKIKN